MNGFRDIALTLIFAGALGVVITPWCCRQCDRILIRRRMLHQTPAAPPQTEHSVKMQRPPSVEHRNITWSYVDCIEALARSARQNQTSIEAVLQLPDHIPSVLLETKHSLQKFHTVPQALDESAMYAYKDEDRTLLWLLHASTVHGYFIPQALDRGASVMREIAVLRDELHVATSQSRLSARILTFLPISVAVLIATFSTNARSTMFTTGGLIAIVIGLGLSWLGWQWLHRLIEKVHEDPLDHAALIAIIDVFAVSVRAGLTLAQAFDRMSALAPVSIKLHCEAVTRSLHHGVALHEAVSPLREGLGGRGSVFIDMILSADRDGLPLVALVDRLSDEARRQRQRDTDVRIRQVPTRLTFPLVFCILPSFIVLTMFPIVSSSVSSLHVPFSRTAITNITTEQR